MVQTITEFRKPLFQLVISVTYRQFEIILAFDTPTMKVVFFLPLIRLYDGGGGY